ncbi:salicylic acid-binding protein 2-like [Cornus florida]|uniref:salicylic acid-binding protein 2-like n=1 Tax=Cornus florida TaxID=4283 RepID=UPI0028A1C485|nr:salicylic acid-binding protein 2-like [Cornus florida]
MEVGKQQKHFVLTHGACHGAWVWYKVKPEIEAAGHLFTAVNLAASGINSKQLDDVRSLHDYTLPLLEVLEAIPQGEKVILVGHSGGGMSAALAMEKYPEKISVAVFLNAIMPDSTNGPSFVLDKYAGGTPPEAWMDTQFAAFGDPNEPLISLAVGPKFMKSTLYHLCSTEDYTLGTLLVRPGSLFMEDLHKLDKFTNEGFGSVPRIYVVCTEDKTIPAEFQRWMIENNPVKEVKEIEGADHMPMFSKSDQVCKCFLEIAAEYN